MGSSMPTAYDMNTDSVPTRITPSMVSAPPLHRTSARAIEDKNVISEVSIALCRAVRTAVVCIFPVSDSKPRVMTSSIRNVLILRIPVIPSLKFPVISELISRTLRLPATIFF